jgi:GTP-binding protein
MSITYRVPTRGLLGFRGAFLTLTRGTGIMHSLFHGYEPYAGEIENRERGSLVAHESGTTTSYALNMAQERGELFLGPGEEVYAGQIVGRRARAGDLTVNVCKKKHVTNHRKAFAEEGVMLSTPIRFSLDEAIEYIGPEDLVEATPTGIRMRKRELNADARSKVDKRRKRERENAVG